MTDSAGTDPSATNPAVTDCPDHRRHVVLGAGPVGRAIAAHLVDQGITPTIVTRSGTSVSGADHPTSRHHRSVTSSPPAVAGADVVYQCAQPAYHRWAGGVPVTPSGRRSMRSPSVGLAARRGGEPLRLRPRRRSTDREICRCAPTTKKGAVRARMYLDLVEAHQAGRIRMVVARASDFFGPHVDGSAFGERFVSQVVAGRKVDILGDPDARHSVTFVRRPRRCDGPAREQAQESWGRAWHVPNAPAVTQRELVELAARAAGTRPDHPSCRSIGS